jgi:hypothetical protein
MKIIEENENWITYQTSTVIDSLMDSTAIVNDSHFSFLTLLAMKVDQWGHSRY